VSERFTQLTAHHSNLRLRSAVQRRQLGQTMNEIEQQLSGLDRGIEVTRKLIKSPAVIVGGVAIFALVGPRRLMRWATRGALVYSTVKKIARLRRP
jgi:hypothetical protein